MLLGCRRSNLWFKRPHVQLVTGERFAHLEVETTLVSGLGRADVKDAFHQVEDGG